MAKRAIRWRVNHSAAAASPAGAVAAEASAVVSTAVASACAASAGLLAMYLVLQKGQRNRNAS